MVRAGDVTLRESVLAKLGGDALSLAVLRSQLGAPWDHPVGRDDLDRLLHLDTSFTEASDGFVFVPALLEGTAWTVRIDAGDGAEGFVRMHPQLSALGWWLVRHVAGSERKWLDESIPALGGRTPREAAGDPVGREELTRLLAPFPTPGPDEVGVMDPDRLRAALGL